MDKKANIQNKKRIMFVFTVVESILLLLSVRLFYIQLFQANELQELALEQHTRDRLIRPKRGGIYDRNGVGLGLTQSVSAVSVIPVQAKGNEEHVTIELSNLLNLDYQTVYKRVTNKVALERIASKVDKPIADEIRKLKLPGVVVDEDIKRIYPYENLASHLIGFVGKDNQGIIGLESQYDRYLKGEFGKILTETDAKGMNLNAAQKRKEPQAGLDLYLTIDAVIQEFAEQTLEKIVSAKKAKRGSVVLMNPQNGEILALANKPDFNLNDPFTINNEALASIWKTLSSEEQHKELNQMWRNFAINDTYEPGSTFKIVTTAAGLEEKVVNLESRFHCSGFHVVADRRIKCWRFPRTHGSENFLQGVENSCNPVFMIVAERLGIDRYYDYMLKFGLDKKTGVDLPGEAVGILHKKERIGPVELATMSFGQSFQITPLQLLRAISATINGGYLITPHVGMKVLDEYGSVVKVFNYEKGKQIITKETSDTMRFILESVVKNGTGRRTYIPGYRVGGKTATSEKLPRHSAKYISSFIGFAPADDPKVLGIVMVDEPQGVYYGGQVTGPVMKEIFENILPYIGIDAIYSEEELKMDDVGLLAVPDFYGETKEQITEKLNDLEFRIEFVGEGNQVIRQFPKANEKVNKNSKIILFTQ